MDEYKTSTTEFLEAEFFPTLRRLNPDAVLCAVREVLDDGATQWHYFFSSEHGNYSEDHVGAVNILKDLMMQSRLHKLKIVDKLEQ